MKHLPWFTSHFPPSTHFLHPPFSLCFLDQSSSVLYRKFCTLNWSELKKILKEENPSAIIVTYPKNIPDLSFTGAQKTREWEIHKGAARSWQNDHLFAQSHRQGWLSIPAALISLPEQSWGEALSQLSPTLGHPLVNAVWSNVAQWGRMDEVLQGTCICPRVQEMKAQINSPHRAHE